MKSDFLQWKVLNWPLFIATEGVVLLHDNMCSFISRVLEQPGTDQVQVLYHPPYSRDMSPSDFYVFGLLKGKRFNVDDEL
ncbi:hypothetical protein TNIN_405441 [Trichonephila inaurata madagascariensis]|uniref:Transposase n=1 Tax=Trichonephila inaurata madagascariensis TaxID=2747483 RepID=A0A8X6YMF2_9ARAC|nr:hypothetical protein TNIN_405441 [Trichonephila inaurata madagascariensis]